MFFQTPAQSQLRNSQTEIFRILMATWILAHWREICLVVQKPVQVIEARGEYVLHSGMGSRLTLRWVSMLTRMTLDNSLLG